jgi:hypothetical protein
MKSTIRALTVGMLTILLAACGDSAKVSEQGATGPNPKLPPPNKTLIPTIKIATATGRPERRQADARGPSKVIFVPFADGHPNRSTCSLASSVQGRRLWAAR